MALKRPMKVRILYAAENRDSANQVVRVAEALPEPVTVDLSPAGQSVGIGTTSVILIWTDVTERYASVFREINDWDRNGTPIHILSVGEAPLLGFLNDLATTVTVLADDETLMRWVCVDVLGISYEDSDRRKLDILHGFEDAVARYHRALVDRLHLAAVVGRRDKQELDSLYLQLSVAGLSPDVGEDALSLVDLVLKSRASRLFVVGPAGAGKSTMLDFTTMRLAQAHSDVDRIPVLLRATELVSAAYSSMTHYIQLVIKGVVPRVGRQASLFIVNSEEFGGYGTVLLIDGVDELRREDRPRLRQMLRQFETEFPDATIVLTARPSGYERSLWFDYQKLEIRPLSNHQVVQYIERFGLPGAKIQLLTLLEASEGVRELARTPFMLALMSSFEGDTDSLPIRRAPLIRACVNSLLTHRPLSEETGFDPQDVGTCLQNLAMRLFKLSPTGNHREGEILFTLEQYLMHRPRSNQSGRHTLRDRANLVLEEIIERTGLLQRDGDVVDFVHRSIWEYFVALALVEASIADLDEVCAIPAYEEPVRLMIGLLDEPKAVERVSMLWRVNRGLMLRSAGESPFDLHSEVERLVHELPDGDAAELVRSLKGALADRVASGSNERTLLDTLGILLPHTRSCETLWEGLCALQAIRERRSEAAAMLRATFDLEGCGERLQQLLAESQGRLRFVRIPAGTFTMGSDAPDRSVDERPAHMVKMDSFEIMQTTVPNGVRQLFPFDIGLLGDSRAPTEAHPMIGVTWHEAAVLAIWFGCRLPTEAEWEYACRSGGQDDEVFLDRTRISEFAWYAANSGNSTHVPAQLKPNSLGLYDILGNVREWCDDWFGSNFYAYCASMGVVENPTGPNFGVHRILRGGCFDWNAANLVPTYRNTNLPNNRNYQNGLRLVRGLPRDLRREEGD